MKEIWKDIKGFEGYFQVSNLGRVKRLLYITNGRIIEEKILKPFVWQSRYLRVDIHYQKNKVHYRKAVYVHKLVAEAFLGTRPQGYEIDHIDRNYLNNRSDNLRYCTRLDNVENKDKELFRLKLKEYHSTYKPCKNRRYISKDGISKMVKQEELDSYLNNGWHFGFDTAKHKHNK